MDSKIEPSAATIDMQLLKDEIGGLMLETGITTITFYKGDFNLASNSIRQQFEKVIAQNQWLSGRLVTGAEKLTVLRHPITPTSKDIDALYTSTNHDSVVSSKFYLAPNSSYADMCTEMYKSSNVVVQTGWEVLDKNKPLTLLNLIETLPGEFALIFSISHQIVDGRTYYEVFKMLQPDSEIRELQFKRMMDFSEKMKDQCGRKELDWADSPSTQIMYGLSMLPSAVCGSGVKCFAFHLDDDKLSAAKAKSIKDSDVSYVSTNDILTSGFFNVCNSRIGMMGFDCREKILGFSKDLAGNYVSALVIDPVVFETPVTIRKMYEKQPYETTKKPLPGLCSCFSKNEANFSMITNWSSFAGELITLKNCEIVIHLPVQNTTYITFDLMIPFTSVVGKKSVIIWTVSTDEDGLREVLPVGECVSKELFP